MPAAIGRMEVRFATMAATDTSVDATSSLAVEVKDQTGAVIGVRSFPFLDNATAAEKTALFNYMKKKRAQAELEILP